MIKRKIFGTRGKLKLSNYFQEFKDGDRVTVIRELSVNPKFPKQIQGRSGIVAGKRGNSYIIKMKDIKKDKVYIIHPLHLRKLK